jgi:hypothetical protein
MYNHRLSINTSDWAPEDILSMFCINLNMKEDDDERF